MAYFNLGDGLLSSGFAREAAATYRRALELEPDNEQARANLLMAERLATAP
jgi:Flp pilus assembly protein TadD